MKLRLTLCHLLLQASGVFGPPTKFEFSSNRAASFHTSGLKPLSTVRPVSRSRSKTSTRISVSESLQWAERLRSLGKKDSLEAVDMIKMSVGQEKNGRRICTTGAQRRNDRMAASDLGEQRACRKDQALGIVGSEEIRSYRDLMI